MWNVRVKLEEGYTRPRWYRVGEFHTSAMAASYVTSYLEHDSGIGSVLHIEIVFEEAK